MILTCVFCNNKISYEYRIPAYKILCQCGKICIQTLEMLNSDDCSYFNIYDNLFLINIYSNNLNEITKIYYTYDNQEFNLVKNEKLNINYLKYKEILTINLKDQLSSLTDPLLILSLFKTEIKLIEDKIKKNLIFL